MCFNPTSVHLEQPMSESQSESQDCFNPTGVHLERVVGVGVTHEAASNPQGFIWNRRKYRTASTPQGSSGTHASHREGCSHSMLQPHRVHPERLQNPKHSTLNPGFNPTGFIRNHARIGH